MNRSQNDFDTSDLDYSEEDEEAWVASERDKVIEYLKRERCEHLGVGEWPAFHVQPYLAIWAVQSKRAPGTVGWWAISGDVPTDYISGSGVPHPREAMVQFSRQWYEMADAMQRGEEHPGVHLGDKQDWHTLAPLLKIRSELIGAWAADDDLWDEKA